MNVDLTFQSHRVKHKAVDPPDYRPFYLFYVDQLESRTVCDIEGVPCSKHERTIVTYGKANCCLNNMEKNGGCSNNSCEFLDSRNPCGHCQGSSDRICCGQIFPDECIREQQHPHNSIPSEPDPKYTIQTSQWNHYRILDL